MQGRPFARLLNHLALLQALGEASPTGTPSNLPTWRQSRGKGKGKSPRTYNTGTKAIQRRSLKLHNLKKRARKC